MGKKATHPKDLGLKMGTPKEAALREMGIKLKEEAITQDIERDVNKLLQEYVKRAMKEEKEKFK